MAEPLEAPPAYSTNTATTPSTSSHLAVPTSPSRADSDRSTVSSAEDLADHLPKSALHELADASRELPEGWIKELDAASGYFYYVDTKASPPRSIWCHPFDVSLRSLGLPTWVPFAAAVLTEFVLSFGMNH